MPQVNLYGNGLVSSGGETLLSDGLGAVRQTTSSSQSVVWSGTSQAFGVPLAASGGTANHYQWGAASGYRTDGFGPTYASPLLKVGARYYDPEFGCFLSRDTDLNQSPYAYCMGDPVNCSDPSGHDSVDAKSTNGHAAVYLGIGIAVTVILFIVLLPAEVPIAAGTLVGIGLAAAISGGTTAAGVNMINAGNKQEKDEADAATRPKKGIGYQGDKVTSTGMNQDYSNSGGHWHKEGGPYSGPPNYPLGPVPK